MTEFGGWRYGGGIYKSHIAVYTAGPLNFIFLYSFASYQKDYKTFSLSHRYFLFLFSEALTPSDTQALWEWVAWEGSGILSILVTISKYLSILFFLREILVRVVKSVKYSSLDKKKFLKLSSCYLSSLISSLSRRLKFNFK